MGSAVYGAGYYQGSEDGLQTGRGQGIAGTLVVGGLLYGATWGYQKLKERRDAKHEQSRLEAEKSQVSGEAVDDKGDGEQ